MYEANSPLLLLALAGVIGVRLRWPVLPKSARLTLAAFLFAFLAANWWWTIRLPIGRDLGLALSITSGLALIVVSMLTLRSGPPYRGTPPRA